MPTIRQSQRIERGRLEPASAALGASGTPAPATAPPTPTIPGPSAFMVFAMPQAAAGYDHYIRQFYGGQGVVPQYRILPVTVDA